MNEKLKIIANDGNQSCDACGNYGAQEIGDRQLCAECVILAGSACGGSSSEADA